MIGFQSCKMYKFTYKQVSPKSDYFGIFRFAHDYNYILFLYAALRLPPANDLKELIRPNSS